MRLRHIEVFHEIYRLGSMTRAARSLSVSQPSISKVLAHAEQQIGFQLFVREGNRLIPTPAAQRLYPHCADVFEGLEKTRRVASNLRESADGAIRLAFTPALGTTAIPDIVSRFQCAHPNVFFGLQTLHMDGIANSLDDGSIDIGVALAPPDSPDFEAKVLATDELVFIAPTTMKLPKSKTIHWQELESRNLIALDDRSPLGKLVTQALAEHQVQPRFIASAETYQLAGALVERGLGAAVVDRLTAAAALRSSGGGVVTRDLSPSVPYSIALLKSRGLTMTRDCEAFCDYLSSQLASDSRSLAKRAQA